MRILITGAAGFIGSNLARTLAVEHQVVGFDDFSTGSAQNLHGIDMEMNEGTILDRAALDSAMVGCDAVVHLAAIPSVPRSIADPLTSFTANGLGTLNVLDAARALNDPLVVVASSSSVYGANPSIPKNEQDLTMPMSPYAVSKLATEQLAIAWQHSYHMRTLAFRFFNVFGPGQAASHAYAAVIPKFLSAALAGKPVQIFGDGEQSRDFTYVGTVCDAIHKVLERQLSHPWPINLAFGTRTSLNSLVELIKSTTGLEIQVSHHEPRVGDVRHSQADCTDLIKLLPDLEPTSLADGLRLTFEWLVSTQP